MCSSVGEEPNRSSATRSNMAIIMRPHTKGAVAGIRKRLIIDKIATPKSTITMKLTLLVPSDCKGVVKLAVISKAIANGTSKTSLAFCIS